MRVLWWCRCAPKMQGNPGREANAQRNGVRTTIRKGVSCVKVAVCFVCLSLEHKKIESMSVNIQWTLSGGQHDWPARGRRQFAGAHSSAPPPVTWPETQMLPFNDPSHTFWRTAIAFWVVPPTDHWPHYIITQFDAINYHQMLPPKVSSSMHCFNSFLINYKSRGFAWGFAKPHRLPVTKF